MKDNDKTLVYFYSSSNITMCNDFDEMSMNQILWISDCKSCDDIQKIYAEAATYVEEEKPEFSLAAVNVGKGVDWFSISVFDSPS